ncbi:hypothetical protein ACLUUI_14335 [Enterobacterales bacterium AW_CKDN230030176-1A_HGKHYDSX7]
MTHSNAQLHNIESITFTEESLALAIAAVQSYGDFAPELIAEDIFRQVAQAITKRAGSSSAAVWYSRSGCHTSKLGAVRNGEQLIAPAAIVLRIPK